MPVVGVGGVGGVAVHTTAAEAAAAEARPLCTPAAPVAQAMWGQAMWGQAMWGQAMWELWVPAAGPGKVPIGMAVSGGTTTTTGTTGSSSEPGLRARTMATATTPVGVWLRPTTGGRGAGASATTRIGGF